MCGPAPEKLNAFCRTKLLALLIGFRLGLRPRQLSSMLEISSPTQYELHLSIGSISAYFEPGMVHDYSLQYK
jgi:hypothetical protein